MELPKKIIRLFLPLKISGFDPKADAGGHPGMHPHTLSPGFLPALPLRPGERRPGGIEASGATASPAHGAGWAVLGWQHPQSFCRHAAWSQGQAVATFAPVPRDRVTCWS